MIHKTIKIKKIIIASLALAAVNTVQGDDSTCFGGTREVCYVEEPCNTQCSCGTLYIGGQLLYLRAFEGGLSSVCDGAEIVNSTVDGVPVSTLIGRNHDPDFKWNPGYRVGVGYEFADSSCGMGVSWTHFTSHSGSGSDENERRWNIHFDVVDAVFACESDWSNCFTLTPFGGIKCAKINQKLHTNFINTIDGATSSTATGTLHEDFKGIGPLFGVEGDWRLGCGISLYGNISIAALYGTYHVRADQNEVFTGVTNIDHLRRKTQACQAVVDAGFGIRWTTCLCGDNDLTVQLGVETHRYFNHNQFCGYGDLSLDGVTLGLGFGF